jgi:tellurite resistance protein TerC
MSSSQKARRVGIGIVGSAVLLAGVAMIVLPGPAFLVIPAGLAILATEFSWAQRWLHKAHEYISEKRKRFGRQKSHSP